MGMTWAGLACYVLVPDASVTANAGSIRFATAADYPREFQLATRLLFPHGHQLAAYLLAKA